MKIKIDNAVLYTTVGDIQIYRTIDTTSVSPLDIPIFVPVDVNLGVVYSPGLQVTFNHPRDMVWGKGIYILTNVDRDLLPEEVFMMYMEVGYMVSGFLGHREIARSDPGMYSQISLDALRYALSKLDRYHTLKFLGLLCRTLGKRDICVDIDIIISHLTDMKDKNEV